MLQFLPLRGRPLAALVALLVAGQVWAQDTRGGSADNSSSAAQGSREIRFLGAFSSGADLLDQRSGCQHALDWSGTRQGVSYVPSKRAVKCDHVVDILAGKAEPSGVGESLIGRPGKITTDSKQRVMVADEAGARVHIFDFLHRKYSWISGRDEQRFETPCGIAVDSHDNIYISDCARGMIAVYDKKGKFLRYIGNFKGERVYEWPSGIAIDLQRDHIYLADTSRHLVFVLDTKGNILFRIGKRGAGNGRGEFRGPTDIVVSGNEFMVLDTLNSRIQVFTLEGRFRREFQVADDVAGPMNLAVDRRGNVYVAGPRPVIRVFDRDGRLLYRLGETVAAGGQLTLPAPVWIDPQDRLFVSDPAYRRVQAFQLAGGPAATAAFSRPR